MSLEAGRLRHRIVLQEKSNEQDSDTGDIVEVWLPAGTVWAAVEPMSGREFVAASALQSKVTTKIIIRHRAIDATMRILHRGKIFNIEAVLPDLESGLEYISLMCSDGTNSG